MKDPKTEARRGRLIIPLRRKAGPANGERLAAEGEGKVIG